MSVNFNSIKTRISEHFVLITKSPIYLILITSLVVNGALILYLFFSGILLKAMLYVGMISLLGYGAMSLLKNLINKKL